MRATCGNRPGITRWQRRRQPARNARGGCSRATPPINCTRASSQPRVRRRPAAAVRPAARRPVDVWRLETAPAASVARHAAGFDSAPPHADGLFVDVPATRLRPGLVLRGLYRCVWRPAAIVALEGHMRRRAVQFHVADSWRGMLPSLVLMGRRRSAPGRSCRRSVAPSATDVRRPGSGTARSLRPVVIATAGAWFVLVPDMRAMRAADVLGRCAQELPLTPLERPAPRGSSTVMPSRATWSLGEAPSFSFSIRAVASRTAGRTRAGSARPRISRCPRAGPG